MILLLGLRRNNALPILFCNRLETGCLVPPHAASEGAGVGHKGCFEEAMSKVERFKLKDAKLTIDGVTVPLRAFSFDINSHEDWDNVNFLHVKINGESVPLKKGEWTKILSYRRDLKIEMPPVEGEKGSISVGINEANKHT